MNSEYDQINFVENIGFSTKSFYEKFSECEAVYQPKNVQQSIVFWLMKKLKMTYVQEIYKTNIKTYRWTLPEDLRYKLENAILNFFRREPTIKKQDLIVLCGSEQFD